MGKGAHVCVCVPICVCSCVYIHVYIYVCTCVYVYAYVCMDGRMYTRVCSHICAYMIFIFITWFEVWFETHRKGVKRNCLSIGWSIREAVETLPLHKGGSSCILSLNSSLAKATMVTMLHVSFLFSVFLPWMKESSKREGGFKSVPAEVIGWWTGFSVYPFLESLFSLTLEWFMRSSLRSNYMIRQLKHGVMCVVPGVWPSLSSSFWVLMCVWELRS